MTIKPTYLITDMSGMPQQDEMGSFSIEFKTEKSALKAATDKLAAGTDEEVWVWKLSHIVSKPPLDPEIEVVK